MGVRCPLSIRPLTADEFGRIDYVVMGQAFATHNALGRFCPEKAFQRGLQSRLLDAGVRRVETEVPVVVSFRDFRKTYSVDLVVEDAVYEIKAARALTSDHQAQLLNYLFLLDVPRGKLLNFGAPSVEGRIHATSLTLADRRRISCRRDRWKDLTKECRALREATLELLADLGAFLNVTLYREVLTWCCGGLDAVLQHVPLRSGGLRLSVMPFLIHSPDIAFYVTAATSGWNDVESHLKRLLSLTELHGLQWINLARRSVQLTTLVQEAT